MNIGIISSSEGGAFKAFFEILKKNNLNNNFFVISDRQCGIIDFAKKNNIPSKIANIGDNDKFSSEAKKQFEKWGGVDFIILFFTRLITAEIYKKYPTYNLHPSLLPAFRGFNPIKKALESGVKYFGTTLHVVDQSTDGGPIFAQAIAPIIPQSTEESLEKVSFVQKVYLLLLLVDFYENNAVKYTGGEVTFDYRDFPTSNSFNPALKNPNFLKKVTALDKKEKTKIFTDE